MEVFVGGISFIFLVDGEEGEELFYLGIWFKPTCFLLLSVWMCYDNESEDL